MEIYQSCAPLGPFLFNDLEHLIHKLMKRSIKKYVLKEADSVSKLMGIDVSKDSWCS